MTTYKSKGVPERNCPQTSKGVYYIHTFLASDFQRVKKKKDYIIDFYVFEAIIQMVNNTVLSIQGKDF